MAILDRINNPDDIKNLSLKELKDLAQELREYIITTVSNTGGHLASNLGVVELTLAMLSCVTPPKDKVVFDVSHQAYVYKILTGRKEQFKTLRQTGGISGFQKISESPCDAFGSGHAGNAISAAIGLAAARDAKGEDDVVIAVVGDGAICNGISLEALNNAAQSTKRLIVVMNDNNMSISKNVGALSKGFGRLMVSPRYTRWRYRFDHHLRWFSNSYHWITARIKNLLSMGATVQKLGFRYIGPVDGHDIQQLQYAFKAALASNAPVFIQVSTIKGFGYKYAEQNPSSWHGPAPFDIETGLPKKKSNGVGWSSAFGSAILEAGQKDKRVVATTSGMTEGTGLGEFAEAFPKRFFDVGISEEHQMIFAAGMAANGLRPVVAVYSTFFQRAIDCFIHDVALQKLPVVVCLDRAGAVPGDGPTHHGVFDISLVRSIPGIAVMQPRTVSELNQMLSTSLILPYPAIIRYPRGTAQPATFDADVAVSATEQPVAIGKAELLAKYCTADAPTASVAVWSLGNMDTLAKEVCELLRSKGVASELVNARFVKPLDTALIEKQLANRVTTIITIEDGVALGGFGSEIEAYLSGRARTIRCGWENPFMQHASSLNDLYEREGLTAEKIVARYFERS